MKISPNSGTSSHCLILMISAAFFALISAITHTRIHRLSEIALCIALTIGSLALLKLLNAIAHLFPAPIRSCLHWLHAMVFEALIVFLAKPFLHFFRTPKVPSCKNPIILVHGYCDDGGVWIYLRRLLSAKTSRSIHTINLGYPFHSIEDYADKLLLKMEEIRREIPDPKFTLIGHSMGGLVCTHAALKDPSVTDVITIGSPISGTHLALIAPGKNGQQMRIGSEFLTHLNQKLKLQNSVRFFHIGTKTDQLVIPSHSALPGTDPTREFLFEDLGHVSLLFSSRVGKLLTQVLLPYSVVRVH